MKSSERINIVAALYAVMYTSVRSGLRGFYGAGTPSFASGFVCIAVCLNLLYLLLLFQAPLVNTLLRDWRNQAFIILVLLLALINAILVDTGRADRWASVAGKQYPTLKKFGNQITVTFFLFSVVLDPIILWIFLR